MGTAVFFCKSTADGKQVIAKNHKDAATKFINEMLMNCYKFKLKKVSEAAAKAEPDFSVSVNMVGETKLVYFQYTSLKPKHSI
ncbi:MAG: hypothetical protein K6E10_04655 [Eubacterium sp.]|nr:hypothetical protein [Eubacterium sp.]